jgi:diguanylate cyclase (GGDEF)-like protein
VRFRHKLSIVLIGLALVPLVAAGFLVLRLLEHDKVSKVDSGLAIAVAAGSQAYHGKTADASAAATAIAGLPDVQQVLQRGGPIDSRILQSDLPPRSRLAVTLYRGNRIVKGTAPKPSSVAASVRIEGCSGCRVVVSGGQLVSSTGNLVGPVVGLSAAEAQDITVNGVSMRAQAMSVPCGDPTENTCQLVAMYPSSALGDAVDSQRLRILLPLILLALIIGVLAFAAADWMSRALNDLAERAMVLARGGTRGDELDQLGAAIDQISSELSSRVGELEAERGRFKETLQRYGETLAATHDLNALVGAILDTAVQATRARGGRLLLYDPERGEAIEQARIGTARGSRTDLPMVVAAGIGLEGEALSAHEPRVIQAPRAMLAVPILREHQLLGLVTTVDPEDGGFGDDDIESLSALAVQAGVAIENARLHRVVERQAVTDALTGLANRRQFYEVLGREYERAQRFGTPLSLILLDIDDFKQINDTRGHLAGDAVLHGVATTLAELIREIDMAARYGGEEFAILLPQTGQEGAALLAERLRREIASRPIRFGPDEIEGITASFGVAAGPEDSMTQIDLIASADAALYQAKRDGKNHVTVAEAW